MRSCIPVDGAQFRWNEELHISTSTFFGLELPASLADCSMLSHFWGSQSDFGEAGVSEVECAIITESGEFRCYGVILGLPFACRSPLFPSNIEQDGKAHALPQLATTAHSGKIVQLLAALICSKIFVEVF